MTQATADKVQLSTLIRTTLFVRDRLRAKAFYKALGFTQLYFEGLLDHPSASLVLGFDNVIPYPVSILKVAGPNNGMLGLFELPASTQAQAIKSGPPQIGESALVFYVSDLDETLPKLAAAGASWLPEPVTFELGHLKHREICLRDTDGFLVNLIERNPEDQLLSGPEMPFFPLDGLIKT